MGRGMEKNGTRGRRFRLQRLDQFPILERVVGEKSNL